MKRDIFDAIMTGIVLSNLDFWIIQNKYERFLLIEALSVVAYMIILKFKRA